MQTHTSETVPQDAFSSGLLDPAMLWRGRWRLAAAVAAAFLLGFSYLALVVPLRTVSARLLVVDQGVALNSQKAAEDRDFLATQAEIVRSPAVIKAVTEALPSPDDPEADPVTTILENLTVDPLVGTKVLSVKYRDHDAERAAQVIQAIVRSYREYLQTTEHETHRETLRLLTEREKELRDQAADLQSRLRQLRQEGSLLGQGREAGALQRTMLSELGHSLSALRNRRMTLENQLQSLVALLEDSPEETKPVSFGEGKFSLASTEDEASEAGGEDEEQDVPASRPPMLLRPAIDSSPILPLSWRSALESLVKFSHEGWVGAEHVKAVREALLTAETREAELTQRLGPKHPDLKAVRSQMVTLEARLREAVLGAPAALERELQALRRQEESLAALYHEEWRESKRTDDLLLEEEQVRTEIQQVQSMHDTVLTQLKQWQLVDQAIAEGRPRVLVRVLDGPTLTAEGLAPPKLVLAFCGLFGALGGAFWIAWRERGRNA